MSAQQNSPQRASFETESKSFSDEEKQRPTLPLAQGDDELLVEWDSDNDPLNPRSLSSARKWLIVLVVAKGSLLV